MVRLDNSLAANRFTAYVPRVDSMLLHGVKYLAQQWAASLSSIGQALGRRAPSPNLTPLLLSPPRNARRMDEPLVAQPPKLVKTLKCNETGRSHPELPSERYKEMLSYRRGGRIAEAPVSLRHDLYAEDEQRDAFDTRITMPDGRKQNLLPPSLTSSSLLNRGVADLILHRRQEIQKNLQANPKGSELWQAWKTEEEGISELTLNEDPAVDFPVGQVSQKLPNTLMDPRTGFAASITLRNDREFVINFGGAGSQGHPIKQYFRAFMNTMGMAPPKNFAQASKLTQIVQEHLKTLNAQLPDGEPKFRLTLSGHSMGGGMATYAALRHKVPAVVFDPLRLGLGARAKVGRPALKAAPSLVTEVVVQGDWVSDSRNNLGLRLLDVPSLALTGRRADALGAIGNRFLVPKINDLNPHSQFTQTLQTHLDSLNKIANEPVIGAGPKETSQASEADDTAVEMEFSQSLIKRSS